MYGNGIINCTGLVPEDLREIALQNQGFFDLGSAPDTSIFNVRNAILSKAVLMFSKGFAGAFKNSVPTFITARSFMIDTARFINTGDRLADLGYWGSILENDTIYYETINKGISSHIVYDDKINEFNLPESHVGGIIQWVGRPGGYLDLWFTISVMLRYMPRD